MTVKYICDGCGTDVNAVGRVSVNIYTSSPHKSRTGGPEWDGELCASCLSRLENAVAAVMPFRPVEGKR